MVATAIGLWNSPDKCKISLTNFEFPKLALVMTSNHPHNHSLHPIIYEINMLSTSLMQGRWISSSLIPRGKRIDFSGNLTPASLNFHERIFKQSSTIVVCFLRSTLGERFVIFGDPVVDGIPVHARREDSRFLVTWTGDVQNLRHFE